MSEPENTKETGRNPDGTFKPGFTGNPGGRPRNPLKEFSLKQFESWTDAEKLKFLSKIAPIDRWKMTEGNPKQDIDADLGVTVSKVISVDEWWGYQIQRAH